MKNKLIVFLMLSILTLTANAQVLTKKQVDLSGKIYTVVMYSYKCFVEKGEGVQVKFYDAGGNLKAEVCRTGGGVEPALFTYPDGTTGPAII